MPASPLNPIPVRPKLRRRFFEAVKFEEALSRACELDPISLGRVSVDPPHDPSDDAEQAYKSYVNKLAHVCDTKRGGTTVTGVAILQDVDRVIYVIGSNERSPADLADLVQFVNSLFDLAQSAQFTDIFHHILKHNRPRIRSYLSRMPDEIDKCVASLSNMPVQARRAVGPENLEASLIGLKNRIDQAKQAEQERDEDFIHVCADVIIYIHNMQIRGQGEDMFLASREATTNPSMHWRQLRHSMARLRAYHVSTRSIISAHKFWPQLFDDAQVIAVPSSKPHPNPLQKTRMATASDMLGRMVGPEEVDLRLADAQALEQFGLNALLLAACSHKLFTPIVHSEVLVYDFVRTYLLENRDVMYWNNWRYVGSSKPTCRLCAYYFSQITDVKVRESHGNLYAKWRAPDVYDEAGVQRRDDILNAIVRLIRQDALRTLESRLPRGKADDSSSFPTVAGWFAENTHRAAADSDVTGTDGRLPPSIKVGDRSDVPEDVVLADMLSRQTLEQNQSEDEDEDEDDESGGAML